MVNKLSRPYCIVTRGRGELCFVAGVLTSHDLVWWDRVKSFVIVVMDRATVMASNSVRLIKLL